MKPSKENQAPEEGAEWDESYQSHEGKEIDPDDTIIGTIASTTPELAESKESEADNNPDRNNEQQGHTTVTKAGENIGEPDKGNRPGK